MNFVYLLLGAALLFYGGETLVNHASKLGRSYGLSPLVVGLTIVAFGTSAPELATSLAAVFRDAPAIALGNVVGSNVANLGLILGLTALVFPPIVARSFLRRDGAFMMFSSLLIPLIAFNGSIGRLEGAVLFALLLGYLFFLLRIKAEPEVEEEFAREFGEGTARIWAAWLGVGFGIALLVGGAHFTVEGAVGLAQQFGVPERVIGLTLVALGTSLPELATSVSASLRREGDIVLGNVVGSNVFNVLAVLGCTAMARPIGVDWADIRLDVLLMLGVSLVTLFFLRTARRMNRREGAALLLMYVGYIAWLAPQRIG